MKYYLLLLSLLLTPTVQAVTFSAEAYGANRQQAREFAMTALEEHVRVEIRAILQSQRETASNKLSALDTQVPRNLLLLGVELDESEKNGEYHCKAVMSNEQSLPVYETELRLLAASIRSLKIRVKSLHSVAKRQSLTKLMHEAEKYDKHTKIAVALGGRAIPAAVNKQKAKAMLLAAGMPASSLDSAIDKLTQNIPETTYIVQPPIAVGAQQATPFSRFIRDKIASKLRSTESRQAYTTTFEGSYEILPDGIALHYSAVDFLGVMVASRAVKLSPSLYENIAYEPQTLEFDQLLHEGFTPDNAFHAELKTTYGKTGLLFHPGQNVELFARLNAPGYFYLVSHDSSNNRSYLFKLNKQKGKHGLVRHVNNNEAKRWLSLGKLDIKDVYSAQSLQLIASNQDLLEHLPKITQDEATGLYVVSASSLKEAVIKTRAKKPKHKNNVHSAEAALTFTSMPK